MVDRQSRGGSQTQHSWAQYLTVLRLLDKL